MPPRLQRNSVDPHSTSIEACITEREERIVKFEQQAVISAPRERVWAFLMDVPVMAHCIPGVETVEAVGDDRYHGVLKVRVGPISLSLRGEVTITGRDEDAGKAMMTVEAADRRVGGSVKAQVEMVLSEIHVVTDAQVMGRIGEFGQPVIRKKADSVMQEFAENLRRTLETHQQEATL